jgi:hypothetical protein
MRDVSQNFLLLNVGKLLKTKLPYMYTGRPCVPGAISHEHISVDMILLCHFLLVVCLVSFSTRARVPHTFSMSSMHDGVANFPCIAENKRPKATSVTEECNSPRLEPVSCFKLVGIYMHRSIHFCVRTQYMPACRVDALSQV